jgi:DNA-binding NtrC family response regulator/predicted hydrocarbon binding protein
MKAAGRKISLAEASRRSGRMLNRGRSDEIEVSAPPTFEDLAECIFFSPGDGRIWLNDQRMLLFHSATLARLRRELIDVMGMERARAAFTRVGYEQGARDAQLIRSRWAKEDIAHAFAAGPRVHTLEGFVKARTVQFEFDIERGHYYGEFLWHESSEADEHVAGYGVGDAPVCWMQTAYATGYTSWLVGKLILFRELECRAMGYPHCRLIAQPLADWGDAVNDIDLQSLGQPERRSSVRSRRVSSQTVSRRAALGKVPSPVVVGMSSRFTAARHMLERAAATQATTLLVGESGVGKELFARTLHELSPRRNGPFVAVNCAAIPETLIEAELFGVEKGAFTGASASREGRFERAARGTLFLDEVASLSLVAQGKLLRALQEREIERVGGTRTLSVDVRVVAATNIDLRQLVKSGGFREDLFFRLNVLSVELPPLRERRDDIPLLMDHFLKLYSQQHNRTLRGFTRRATEALLHYDYPGNLREMQNLIERGVVFADDGGMIDTHHMFRSGESLPIHTFTVGRGGALRHSENAGNGSSDRGPAAADPLQALVDSGLALPEIERRMYEDVLKRNEGNVSAAARALGLSRAALDYRLRKLNLLPPWSGPRAKRRT